MKIYNEIHANTDKWESGELGATQEFVKVSEFTAKDLQKSIELQPISLRVNKDLLEDLKSLAKMHNIGYQPLMKQILKKICGCGKNVDWLMNTSPNLTHVLLGRYCGRQN